jgi:peptide/nickel transport system substrate-binding protein
MNAVQEESMFQMKKCRIEKTVAIASCALAASLVSPLAAGPACADEAAKTLTIAASAAPGSLDPTKTSNGGTQTFYQELAYAPLLDKDAHGNLIAGLATQWGWEAGAEGTRFDLTIRKGAKFADGEPVSATAVANSLNFFAKNASGPTAASYAGWQVTAKGDDQVVIETHKPSPILADLLTPYNIGGNVISPKGLADSGKLASATFGAGPYVYDPAQSVAGDHYTYTPNANYYDHDKVKFDKVIIKVVANNNSALQALRSGQIDLFSGDPTQVASVRRSNLSVISAPSGFAALFLVDWKGTLVPALGNQKVRQALNFAIARADIAKVVFGELGKPLDQPNTPGWDAYSPALDSTYPYNVDKARQLLKEGGYPNGFTMNILYTAFEPTSTRVIQAVAQQLSKIGVTVNLTGASNFTELNADLASKKFSGFAMMWGGQTQFANVNQLWQMNSSSNFFHNSVDGLDPAFAAYLSSTLATRSATAQAVQKVIVDQAITLPVAQVQSPWFANPSLKGFTLDPTGNPVGPLNWSK